MKRLISLMIILNILIFPIISNAENEPVNLTCESAILMEGSTGKVLYEKNANDKRHIASVTKIMTALLIMESINNGELTYDEMVTTSEYASSMGGSQIFLEAGEQMSVNDMLKGIMVSSGNDACVAMAEHISGSVPKFIEKMNTRAKELLMNNTQFVNVNGLDGENQYSTALDVAIMSRELLKHKDITKYSTIWVDTLRNGEFGLANTNKLIRFYDGTTGLKTGYTSTAKHCISASATRNDMDLIAVVLGAPTSNERFSDAKALLDYGFKGFEVKEGIKKDEFIKDAIVKNGKTPFVGVVAGEDYSILSEKSKKENIERQIEIDEPLNAPVNKGQVVGKIRFVISGSEVGMVDLVASNDIPKKTYFDILKNHFEKWMGIV